LVDNAFKSLANTPPELVWPSRHLGALDAGIVMRNKLYGVSSGYADTPSEPEHGEGIMVSLFLRHKFEPMIASKTINKDYYRNLYKYL
jgi:hypothetical protein